MKELTVDAAIENIAPVTAFADEALEALGCPLKARRQIDVAIDEIFGNIAHYAYGGGPGPVTVRLGLEETPRAVTITFTDGGTPFDPTAQAEPDTTPDAEARDTGGLGIFIVRRTMDDMRYERRDGKNILTIRKQF